MLISLEIWLNQLLWSNYWLEKRVDLWYNILFGVYDILGAKGRKRRRIRVATLYIIGNGFDLHHKLHTTTVDFKEYLKKESVYNEVMNAFDVFSSYAVDWNEYEQSLSEIDLEEIEEQNAQAPDYLSDHEYDRDGGILNMQMYCDSLSYAVRSALANMVRAAEIEIEKKSHNPKLDMFDEGDTILSFNYTSTVESLYNLRTNPIFHIHGYYPNNEELIFGYADPETTYEKRLDREDEDYYINEQRRTIVGFYEDWQKHLRLDALKDFLQKAGKIDAVKVYGHSMAAVDAEYMEVIEQMVNPAIWEVSYYSDEDRNEKIETVKSCSFAKKVRLFEW